MSVDIKLNLGNYPRDINTYKTTLKLSLRQKDIAQITSNIKHTQSSIQSSIPQPNLIIKIPHSQKDILNNNTFLEKYLLNLKLQTKKETSQNDLYLVGVYSEETNKFISKLQNIFKQIPKLNNFLNIHIENNKNQSLTHGMLQDSVVHIQGQIDESSIQTIQKSLKDVSPGFLNSPLMELLSLFISMHCELQLDSLDQLPEQLKKSVIGKVNSEESTAQRFIADSEPFQILFIIPQLFSISGHISPRTLQFLLR